MEQEIPIMQVEIRRVDLDITPSKNGGCRAPLQAMALRMLFIVISILIASSFMPAQAQPTPEMERAWEAKVEPKIHEKMRNELKNLHFAPAGKASLLVRAYLEKNGALKRLRIDDTAVESNLPKSELSKLKAILLEAVRTSAPFPYSSVKDSRLPHMGLFVEYKFETDFLHAGLTHPEDCPGP